MASVNTGFSNYWVGEGCLLRGAYCKALYITHTTVSSVTHCIVCACLCCRGFTGVHFKSFSRTSILNVSQISHYTTVLCIINRASRVLTLKEVYYKRHWTTNVFMMAEDTVVDEGPYKRLFTLPMLCNFYFI